MPQSQFAANPWHQQEEKRDTNQHAQNKQTHEKHADQLSLPQVWQSQCKKEWKTNSKHKARFWLWYSQFPFTGWRFPPAYLIWVYISQPIRVARASSNLSDFNCRNKALTAKLQGYRYFKLRKAFSHFYRSALLEKYSVSLKTLLQQGISEPEFYGDLVYRFRKHVGKSNFSEEFQKTY